MKKYIICNIFLLAVSVIVKAQTPKNIDLDKGCKLLSAVPTANGVLIQTGNEYVFSFHHKWHISYYNEDLVKRYDVPIKHAILKCWNPQGQFVVSPSGNQVYFLQFQTSGTPASGSWYNRIINDGKSKQWITYIDSFGAVTDFKIKREFKVSRLNVIFADDKYLYYVTKEKNPDQTRRQWNKNPKPLIQFVRIAHDKSISKIMVELPKTEDEATQWSYFGNTTEAIYFVSKTMDGNNKATYRVAVVDADGKLLDDFKLNTSLKAGDFRAGYNHSSADGVYVVQNHNIKVTVSSYTTPSGTTYTSVSFSANPEAYGDIMLDQQTGGFYIYGLSGPHFEKTKKLFAKTEKPVANGFYLDKFDQDGKKQWDYQGKLAGINDYYSTKALFIQRNIKLNIGAAGNLRFQTFSPLIHGFLGGPPQFFANTFEINGETGKYITGYSNEFGDEISPADLGACHKSGDKTELGKFLSKRDLTDYSILNFRLSGSNIVIKNLYNDDKLELYKFDDE